MTISEAGAWGIAVFAADAMGHALDIRPSDEVADWRWVAADAIVSLDTTPNLADVLAAVLRTMPRRR